MKRFWENGRLEALRTERIEVSEAHVKLRIILFVVMLLVAVASFAYGINSLFSSEPGMQEITVPSSSGMSCGDEFTFYYYLGTGEVSATEERKAVQALYAQAAVDAYRLFSVDAEFEDCKNLWYLNEHVNEEVVVEPVLYEAFALLEESGTRYHYLAPVYEMYASLFHCEYDSETLDYDPYLNEDLRAFYAEMAVFSNDPDEIKLELLGNNTVRLCVSDGYLRFAAENGISRFIDFFWMKNAFIADYIAGIMLENGYMRGTLISCDGFMRYWDDDPETELSFTLSHREGTTISTAEILRFSDAESLVYLKDYPLGNGDEDSYYVREDGTIRFPYIDPADGLCKSSVPEIAVSSNTLSCAELALSAAPVYIADALDEAALQALLGDGIVACYRP